jgi:diguanylate cyclase (GGDEF)-like protein
MDAILNNTYYGQILSGSFSEELKTRVAECIRCFKSFDETGGPTIPYIAAWQEQEKIIWYEYVGRQFVKMLGCAPAEAADTFRGSIIQRRIYRYREVDRMIREDILSREELRGQRTGLRDEVKQKGLVEAVYKSSLPKNNVVWFKDQALVEFYKTDNVCVSLGCLTDVTKEMEAEEHLRSTRAALKKSEEMYRELSVRDNLTGLYNTRYLYQSLVELIQQSKAENRPFSLVFMDIDDFKHVVDTHGHLNASQALQEVGKIIQSVLENPAYGVAYAGDEFVMVLPGYDKLGAMQKAEELRTRIRENIYLQNKGLAVQLSASLGVATCPEDAATLTDVLALADQAMFAVKKRGKDSVSG